MTSRQGFAAGQVITGESDEVIRDGAVIIDGNRIEWVGPASQLPDSGVEIHDLGPDATLMPGMIDTHVHLCFDGSCNPVQVLHTTDTIERYTQMLQSARELLSVGVTTARDLGAPELLDVRVKQAINSGKARGPRMLTVTSPITITGGHCYFMGGEAESPDGVRKAVRRARRDGADHIKVMATGGNMTPGTLPSEPQFTVDELKAIVEEAHKFGMKVASHCHGPEGIRRSVEAGVDSLEHFTFNAKDGSRQVIPEVMEAVANGPYYVSKTFSVALPGFLKTKPDLMESNVVRTEMDAGIKIVIGSDSGIDNAPMKEFVTGLEAMAAYGMTNDEVLHSVTALGAESLGLEDVTGKLKAGLEADLLAVEGDPREDLGNLRNIRLIITRGEKYTPEFFPETTWNDEVDDPKYVPAG